jgi:hypothetical protein
MRRRLLVIAAVAPMAAFAMAVMAVMAAAPARADLAQSRVVSEDPADRTPHVLDGTVRAFAEVDGKIVVGGTFTQVRQARTRAVLAIRNLFAYDKATGAIDRRFRPSVDKEVLALQPGADGTVYAAGSFTRVNGSAVRGLARLNLSGGAVVPSFRGRVTDGRVNALVRRGETLYAGGTFHGIGGLRRTAIARLDAATGTADRRFAVTPAAPLGDGEPRVESIAVDPRHTKVVFDGDFTRVNGLPRSQLAVLDVTATSAALSDWATDRYGDVCDRHASDGYLHDLDFDPTGRYFVVVTAGGTDGGSRLCAAAARWDVAGAAAGRQPVWVNKTGGDSLLSVSVTGAAVYVGGHQRWQDNPLGRDDAGPGAVSRPGIAALDPETGRALPWNPTRTRGHGVEVLAATGDGGLLVGCDTEQLGREYHARVGMFPAG